MLPLGLPKSFHLSVITASSHSFHYLMIAHTEKTITRIANMNTDVPMVGRGISIICHPVDLLTVISVGWVAFSASLLQVLPMHVMFFASSVTTMVVLFTCCSVVVILAASVTGAGGTTRCA